MMSAIVASGDSLGMTSLRCLFSAKHIAETLAARAVPQGLVDLKLRHYPAALSRGAVLGHYPRPGSRAQEAAMAAIAELDSGPETIEASLDYLAADGSRPVSYVAEPGGRDRRSGSRSEAHRVTLYNGRRDAARFSLDVNGFRFVRHDSAVADFYDDAAVERVYYPEMERLVMAESGARRVVVFDHTLRTEDPEIRETRKIREVVRRVHNDYTEWSAPQRVRDIMGEETLVVTERRYRGRTGQTYAITYDPGHRWYWFPRMRPDEALVFKVYDSLRDGRARWTAHTAFADPTSPPGAPPRESIEIRTLAFF